MALAGLSTVKKICYGKEHLYNAITQKVLTSVAHIVRDYITNGLATTKSHGYLFMSLT